MAKINPTKSKIHQRTSVTAVARESKQSQAAATVGVEESKGNDQAQTDSDNIAAKDKDATLRQQLIPVGAPPITPSTSAAGGEGAAAAAGGVEESKGEMKTIE